MRGRWDHHIRRLRYAIFVFVSACLFSGAVYGAGDVSPLQRISAESGKGKQQWTVELASDDESRAKGLMFRKKLAKNTGMLFRFDNIGPVSMWMKNTFVSLDMVFLAESGRIDSIHFGAVPQSLDIISSRAPVRYVLEINSGEAKQAGLKPGLVMRHPWFVAGD